MTELHQLGPNRWHAAVNRFSTEVGHEHFMYEAMNAATEVPRLTKLFAMERTGTLPQFHQQCSQQEPEPIKNVLTCCLGTQCSDCPFLLALEKAELPPEEIDTAKAWTCVTHIISQGGDPAKEGYVLTTSDVMFWERTYESLAAGAEGGQGGTER